MVAKGELRVSISKKEVVAAELPLQEHWLPLSNLDLLLPPVDVGVLFCYQNTTSHGFGAMVGALKKAMAQALVSYYALAGEVVLNSVGEPEILCNNRGVDFIEAHADVELKHLNLYNPDDTFEGKLVPNKKKGVLAVQATQLKCGGLAVGCTFDHRLADAYSANMFLVSWADMAQSKPISQLPSFRRSLLNPRRPGCVDPKLDFMYVPISTLPPPKQPLEDDDDHLMSRIYYRTKLEAFSAFLWKMVAQCDTTNDHKITKMVIVVDGRSRLCEGGSDEYTRLMGSYFGNVLSIPFGGERVNEVIEKPLCWVAEQVHDFLENAVTKDHFLGLIDWVEAHRPEPALAKIYIGTGSSEDGPAFVVSSGQRFPVSKVDFGWGKPFFGSYHFPWGGNADYVMPMPTPTGKGDWIVYMHLMKKQLELIEAHASNLFTPLTFDHLNS
ncbi:hypothetical protein Dsin_007191 [Dipteronia sinensis]|uniref:Uncharacterized protein n=1 Tax=Dipteronia sinensis TaxID=43782 RepID=A0AAE0B1D4_9ROSI|nr:hypothetical protein Dsin_007191 [Dipteronia sinensis]